MSLVYETLLGLSSGTFDTINVSQLNVTNENVTTSTITNLSVQNLTGAFVYGGTGAFSNIIDYGALTVAGTGTFNNPVYVNSNEFVSGNIIVSGALDGLSTSFITGPLTVSLSSFFNHSLTVGQLFSAGGTGTFGSDVNISGNANIGLNLAMNGTLMVGGTGTFQNDLHVVGNTYMNQNVLASEALTVLGQFACFSTGTFVGPAIVGGTLVVGETGTFLQNVNISGFMTSTGINSAGIYTVNNGMTTAAINAIIANTNYNHILFAPGLYTLSGAIIVSRSFITLDGQWCELYMGDGVNNPVIAIGDLSSSTPGTSYIEVVVKNFLLNGNLPNQSSEYMTGKSWVTNCCVFITYMGNCWLQNLDLYNARSGGMTITYRSNAVQVSNCSSNTHYFDNYTCYGSTNLVFSDNYGAGCSNGAGISMDDNCQYVTITGNTFTNNKLGIFARWCEDIVCTGNSLSGNAQQGLFLAGYGTSPTDNGLTRWIITGNSISNNSQQGLWIQSSNYFSIAGNTISANGSNGVVIGNDTSGNIAGTSSYNNVSGNVICANGGWGIYMDPSNNYSIGARSNYYSLNIVKNNTSGNIGGDLSTVTYNDDTQLETATLIMPQISGYITTVAPQNAAQAVYFNLPVNNGTSGYVLSTDGSGNTSWITTPVTNDNLVYAQTTNQFTVSSPTSVTTFMTTSFTSTITPSKSSSKIKITLSGTLGVEYGVCILTIYNDTSGHNLSGSSAVGLALVNCGTPTVTQYSPIGVTVVDSPASTSAQTYDVYISGNATNIYWNYPGTLAATLILEEIFI